MNTKKMKKLCLMAITFLFILKDNHKILYIFFILKQKLKIINFFNLLNTYFNIFHSGNRNSIASRQKQQKFLLLM